MPDLQQTLLKHDLGHLKIIAELWGLEVKLHRIDSAVEELAASILDLKALREILDSLPAGARDGLNALVDSGGKMEWDIFSRDFGGIREMGPARRDREKPHLNPASTAEILFYRGLLAKAFFDSDKGAREFAYLPDDLIPYLPADQTPSQHVNEPLGRPATPVERSHEIPASDRVLDDATTLLAALRVGNGGLSRSTRDLYELLIAAKLIKKNIPQAEAARIFLEAARAEALNMLYTSWVDSRTFDELRLIPGLICEGEWKNDPRSARRFLLKLLNDLPKDKWWSLPAFLRDLKAKHPDFQRPAGDYDSWFIKRESDGQYLRGFAYWDPVDGALVKYVIQTLHWLGQVDLASPGEGKEFTAFRPAQAGFSTAEDGGRNKPQRGKISVASNGKIAVARSFSRAARYQLARFCEWDGEKGDDYLYHVSARSLKHASEQGLKAEQLLSLLVKYTRGSVPPALVKALKRWDANGAQARVESLHVLRVSRPEVMEEMRNSKAGKFLGEILSPTAMVVKEGAIQKVIDVLLELGLFTEVKKDG